MPFRQRVAVAGMARTGGNGVKIKRFPLVGSGWIVGAGFGLLCNSSTASGEGTPELNSSDFETYLFLDIS